LVEARRTCDLLQSRVAAIAPKCAVIVCSPTLPLVPIAHTSLARASEFSLELRRRVAAFAAELSRIAGVRLVDQQRVDALSPAKRMDVKSDLATGFPYTLAHASVLAELA